MKKLKNWENSTPAEKAEYFCAVMNKEQVSKMSEEEYVQAMSGWFSNEKLSDSKPLFKRHDMETTTICMLQPDGSYGEVANTERGFGNQEHNCAKIMAHLSGAELPFNPYGEVMFFQDGTDEGGSPMWFAIRDCFINLAESNAGHSTDMNEAYEMLLKLEAA